MLVSESTGIHRLSSEHIDPIKKEAKPTHASNVMTKALQVHTTENTKHLPADNVNTSD